MELLVSGDAALWVFRNSDDAGLVYLILRHIRIYLSAYTSGRVFVKNNIE